MLRAKAQGKECAKGWRWVVIISQLADGTQLSPKWETMSQLLGLAVWAPRALTIVLLLQLAQDPEGSSFWDFQGVCLLQVVGKLLPGPQPANGRFHLLGLTGAFLQLLLVIAGEAVPPSSARPCLIHPPPPLLFLSPCSVWPAQEQGHKRSGF